MSQAESLAAVKVRVPLPVFVTETLAAAGFVPPCVPEKLRVDGEIASTGLGGGGG